MGSHKARTSRFTKDLRYLLDPDEFVIFQADLLDDPIINLSEMKHFTQKYVSKEKLLKYILSLMRLVYP